MWCADITYIRMGRGYAYPVAVMDWRTRTVLLWKLSNTLDSGFCVEALAEAVEKAGRAPEIFNTDQCSQFTSDAWLGALQALKVRISMDGKGRWMDNVFIERLWRSVKHEGVYLWGIENLRSLHKYLSQWFKDYNTIKPHQFLEYKTPWECYRPTDPKPLEQAA